MAKKVYIGVFIAGLLIVGVYSLLGGFKTVPVEEVGATEFRVVGQYFIGEYDDKSVAKYFVQAREMIVKGEVDGQLCVVTYQPDSLLEDFVSQFIGIVVGPDVAVPTDFEERSFSGPKAALATLDMHPIALPNPQEIQGKLVAYAAAQGWPEPQSFIEIYKPDNSMQVYVLAE